jgi:GNAT superfamily N-acetyltransferase
MAGNFVNKLTVDRDNGLSTKPKTVYILRYVGDELAKRNLKKIVEVIYKNFEELETTMSLNHNRREIARLLTSPKGICIIATIGRQMVGYLIAELTVVENLRQLMHIAYLFTSPVYRGKGVATYMLNKIQTYAQQQNITVLSLTFDTYNKPLERFYLNNNFFYDSNLRSYQRHDMLVKYI